MADQLFVAAELVRPMFGFLQVENIRHESYDDALLFTYPGDARGQSVKRPNGQRQNNLIDDVATHIRGQRFEIGDKRVALFLEFV